MRKLILIAGLLLCGWLTGVLRADTYKLTSGESVTGELILASANDLGVQIKVGDGQYQKLVWSSFSQEDLKNLATNPKLEPFVEPFIEVTRAEKIKKTEVNIKEPPKLERPAKQGLFGAMFSSSVGVFVLLVIWGATIYAGYEVAIFRARNPYLVAGLSAIPGLGVLAPIVFLSLPTQIEAAQPAVEGAGGELAAAGGAGAEGAATAAAAMAEQTGDEVNPMRAEGAQHPSGLKIHVETEEEAKPKDAVFQRGQFTFNRRFFETKFPAFFPTVRPEHDRHLVMLVKTGRGEFNVQRISRIAANDFHVQVHKGHTTEEVMIGFQEIQQVQLKHQ